MKIRPAFYSSSTMFLTGHLSNMLCQQPLPTYPAALGNLQKFTVEFLIGLRHIPSAVAVQKRCLLSFTYRRFRGDHLYSGHLRPSGILSAVHLQTSNPPMATRPRVYLQLIKTIYPQHAVSIHVPFWKKLPADGVKASTMKPFDTYVQTDYLCFLKCPYNPQILPSAQLTPTLPV